MLISQQNLSTRPADEARWEPHYRAKFTDRQLEILAADRHPWVDTRGLRTRLNNEGLEVELIGNPMNDGKILCCTANMFLVDNGVQALPVDFHIWSITIPLGLGKLAITLKREVIPQAALAKGTFPTYRVLLF